MRDLTLHGKVLVLKSYIFSSIGYLIEMEGIPQKFIKEIKTLCFKFLWDGKVRQVSDLVTCIPKIKGGLGMIDIDSLVKTKQLKWIHKILNDDTQSWNILGKFWLQSQDRLYDMKYTYISWSILPGLKFLKIPKFYQECLKS